MKHDTTPATLTPAERRALAALAESPIGQQIRAEADAAAAERRTRIIETLHAEQADLREAAARHAAEAERLRPKLEAAHTAWQAALHAFAAAERSARDADDAAHRAEGRALRELRPLGGTAIDDAIRELCFVEVATLGSAGDVRIVAADLRGRPTETSPRWPSLLAHVARVRELRREIEALRLADMTPAAIEAQCLAAVAEASGVELPTIDEPGRRSLAIAPSRGMH